MKGRIETTRTGTSLLNNKYSGEEIFSYFAAEVFDKLDCRMQEFLIKAALLPWMTTEMTERLTGLSDADRILNILHLNNYFTEGRSGPNQKIQTYQFHPLFREFLLSSGRTSFSGSALSEIQAKAACLLEEAGYHEDAAGLFLEAADWEGLIRVILGQAQSLIMQGRYHLLEEWIKGIPEDFLKAIPWLYFWLGACRLPYNQSESLPYFEMSFQEFRQQKDAAGVYLSWCGVMDSIAYSYDRFDRFDPWIAILDDLAREFGGIPSEEIETFVASSMLVALALVLVKLTEALYYDTMSLKDPCLKAVTEGLDIAGKTGIHYCDFMIMGQAAICYIRGHDFKTAGGFLKKMASLLSTARPWDVALYHHILTLKSLDEGNFPLASQEADTCLRLTRRVGAVFSDYLAHLLNAMSKHEVGEHKEAREHLEVARKLSEKIKSPYLEFTYLISKAWFALSQGRDREGLRCLEKGFAIGRQNGYMSPYSMSTVILTRLCMKAIEAGIEVEYARTLIRHHNLMPESPQLHLEAWPWPLKIYTLGRFGILKDDRPLRFSGKIQQRPLAMLKALIAYGGRGVTEDLIIDALWPDALGDVARQSFATTLHRLRQLLGCEKAIHYQDRRLTLDQKFCWVDSWAFERFLGEADAFWNNGAIGRAVELTEKGVKMYGAAFLFEEVYQSWALSMRERLRGKFLRSVGRLGRYWQQKEEWNKAIECYQKGIEVENLAEEFYQSMMTCYQSLGRKAEAVSVYKRWKRILSSSIEGIAPSPKTEAIYRSLLSD